MKPRNLLQLSLLALLALPTFYKNMKTGGGNETASGPFRNQKLLVAADLHYLDPGLNDHGAAFHKMLGQSDAKLTEYSNEITESFLRDVIREKPEALIILGDLIFNGARQSHEAMARKLGYVISSGVPVYVLPGNHDLYNPNAAKFEGDRVQRLPQTDSEAFREIYHACGFDQAFTKDRDSLSYMIQLKEDTRLLMLDTNTAANPCGCSERTLKWIERMADDAEKDGQLLIVAGHQNLFKHSMFTRGYVLTCAERLQEIFAKHHVRLMLSGHMHLPHILTQGETTEIAVSSLALNPCQYGVLRLKDDAISFETVRTDVAAWARAKKSTDPGLLDFDNYAKARSRLTSGRQCDEQLAGKNFTDEQKKAMTNFAAELNAAYFSGNLTHAGELDPDGSLMELWKSCGGFYSIYLPTILPELGKDYTKWHS